MAHTTAAKVRKILPSLLIDDDDLGAIDSGTNLTLNNPAIDCPTILKDGSTLTKDTDYTFEQPITITLGTAATGEQFIAQVYLGVSNTDLDTIIAKADRYINNFFSLYDTPDSSNLEDWSSDMSAAMYLQQYASAIAGGEELATQIWDRVIDAMNNYRDNVLENIKTQSDATYPYVRKVNR